MNKKDLAKIALVTLLVIVAFTYVIDPAVQKWMNKDA